MYVPLLVFLPACLSDCLSVLMIASMVCCVACLSSRWLDVWPGGLLISTVARLHVSGIDRWADMLLVCLRAGHHAL